MEQQKAKLMVLPELCITGYTCGICSAAGPASDSAKEQLLRIVRETSDVDALIFIGLPIEADGKLYKWQQHSAGKNPGYGSQKDTYRPTGILAKGAILQAVLRLPGGWR